MSALQEDAELLRRSLDRFHGGALLMDGSSNVLHSNVTAQRILSAGDGLLLRHGMLSAWRVQQTAELRAAVSQVLEEAAPGPVALAIDREGGGRPYVLMVIPLLAAPVSAGRLLRGALLLVNDPDRQPVHGSPILQQLFGFTRREAALADALCSGAKVEEYAAEHCVSVNTVRSQLRSIFAKTHTGGQTELIRLLRAVPQLE